jgi:hypothetical protein
MVLFRIISSHLKLTICHESERQGRLTPLNPTPNQPGELGCFQNLQRTFRLSRSGYQIYRPANLPASDNFDNMSLPPSKRSRSSDSLGRRLSQSGDGTETTVSRDKKYSAYRDVNYPVVLETKGSFMRPSEAGLVDEDKRLYERLLLTSQPKPHNSLFDDEQFETFHSLLRGRSEARVYLHLHPLIVPSAENLYISGREEFGGLIEGYK